MSRLNRLTRCFLVAALIIGAGPGMSAAQPVHRQDSAAAIAETSITPQANSDGKEKSIPTDSIQPLGGMRSLVQLERSQISSVLNNAILFGLMGLLPIAALMATSY